MVINFFKYQGAGNDFIIIDNRNNIASSLTQKRVKELCDRNTGIGSNGLILLESDPLLDFKMVYFNSDGRQSSMCGNGGRCIMKFAHQIELIDKTASFSAVDGEHKAKITGKNVHLSMQDVNKINQIKNYNKLTGISTNSVFLNTGSPHIVNIVDRLDIDFISFSKKIRYSEKYKEKGININIVKVQDQELDVRSYERGVEDETLSCGTGVTACAIASHFLGIIKTTNVKVNSIGGELFVKFSQQNLTYNNVWLIGPAEFIYTGEVSI